MTSSIVAFFLGGTISMTGHDGGVVSRVGAAELVEAVPALGSLDVRLEARDFRRLPSACLSFDDILELADVAAGCDADGIVVVQGTDTIEETAYLIDLVWTKATPVVVTGAMRNASMAGADGPANLLGAVAAASSGRFDGIGAVVVFNDEVHAARWVRKTHSTSTATFASPNAGPIGHLVEGRAVPVASVPRRAQHAPVRPITARVPLLTIGLDDDGQLLAALRENCDGLVVAGFGVGHVPDRLAGALGDLARQVPVVLTSRTGSGPVLSHTYGFAGSETDLLDRGLISGGLLDPYKARVLLRVALGCGYDRAQLAAAFAEASGLA
ncbi:MAG: asparaginase [Jatrophihabitantaceae bacterium]